MASTDIAGKQRFVVLDGMRGVAALVVITDHVHSDALVALLPGAYLAVDFFFVLSGFVLAHVYGGRIASGMSALDFLRVRVIRLYPLYLLGTLLGVAFAVLAVIRGWDDSSLFKVMTATVFGLFMLPAPPGLSTHVDSPYPFNGPAWSLFFELLINVMFVLLARRAAPIVPGAIVAASAALLVPTAFILGELDGGFAWSNFIAGFPRVFFSFFAGVLLYQARSRWTPPPLAVWAAFAVLLAVFAAPAGGPWRPLFDLIAVVLVFPALVAFSADSTARGAVEWTCATMGLLSYGIYVLHVPIWAWLRLVIDHVSPGAPFPGMANVALVAACAVAAAAILNAVYDVPARRFLSGGPPRRAAPAGAAPGKD